MILSPRRLSRAGRRVMEAKTAEMTTKMAPRPMAMKTLEGTSNIPISPKTTAIPLKKTVREAVPPACPMASIFSRPRARSSL